MAGPFSDAEIARYARHLVLHDVGGAGQQRFREAKVLVIGAGGLGAPMLMYLSAAGIGTIGIVDDDSVALSNLQRQVIHDTDAVDELKVTSAARTMRRINPHVQVIPHAERISAENAEALISQYDLVADGCDNFATRHLVSDTCVRLKRTLVSGAVTEFHAQISVFKPHAGAEYPCYRCFVPEEPPRDGVRTCSDVGILGAVAGVAGTLQAVEVLKEIGGFGTPLAGRILLYDGLDAATRTVRLKPDPGCPACSGR